MKPLFSSILVAGFIMLAASAQAQYDYTPSDDTSYHYSVKKDTVYPPYIIDSLRTNGFYMTVTGGFTLGLTSEGSTGGTTDLSFVFGKQVFDFTYSHLGAGSITTGLASDFIFSSPAPTVPDESWSIIEASYGQRFTPNIAWMVGFAQVSRIRNTETTKVTDPPGWFSNGGTYWNYTTKQDSYFAIPVSVILFSRWSSWLGMQLKAQVLLSSKEVSGNLGISVGFGGFPRSTP